MTLDETAQPNSGYEYIRLKTKPKARLCYRFHRATRSDAQPVLVVFVNGLGMPQAGWEKAIVELQRRAADRGPCILTYDRFGQGMTEDRDPADAGAEDPSHAHDCMAAMADMHQLIQQIVVEKMDFDDFKHVRLLMVGNSIGCSLIRLYAQEHPQAVAGAVFLDSTLTDTDFVSIFPDHDAEGFDPTKLPAGVTAENLRESRKAIGALFHPDVGNKEGLSRRNLIDLLPQSHSPALHGYNDEAPFVTVVGHDFETFAKITYEGLGIPVEVTQSYMNPYWQRYNEGLARLTEPEKSLGPVQAPGAGHYIQADNPEFVARTIWQMLDHMDSTG